MAFLVLENRNITTIFVSFFVNRDFVKIIEIEILLIKMLHIIFIYYILYIIIQIVNI